MSKKIRIEIESALKEGKLSFPEIFCCKKYQFEEKRGELSDCELKNMLFDMHLIRSFENKLKEIKKNKKFKNKNISLMGPVHLINGEEAACVGQAYALDINDYSFGSHRSHGELLARSMAAIARATDQELLAIMTNYQGGYIYSKVQDNFNSLDDIKRVARNFVLYGAISEVLGKNTGFQKGGAGSMHMFFAPFGVFPSNAIVGASAPIAVGAALYKKIKGKKGISVANLGDGAIGCGVVFESMNFAAMKQYDLLWKNQGGLPILFSFFNNGYGMGGNTVGETMAYDKLVRIGAGISEKGINSERVNGMDPLSVYYATSRKKKGLSEGNGPALLDLVTYRFEGHSESDKEETRDIDEISLWKKIDPLNTFAEELLFRGIISQKEIEIFVSDMERELDLAFDLATDEDISSRDVFNREDSTKELYNIRHDMEMTETVSKGAINNLADEDDPVFTIKDALSSAVLESFCKYEDIISFGVNARDWGGSNSINNLIKRCYGYERLFNSPVSEACMVSVAIGYSMCGGRAIVDLMFSGFIGRAGDEIFNQLAKWNSLSAGYFKLRVIVRVTTSRTYGAQHSQDWVSLVAHIPGLIVLYPVAPQEAKGLFNSALEANSPVIFFENKELFAGKELLGKVPNGYFETLIGEPIPKKEGKDITVLTIGPVLYDVLKVSENLEKLGLNIEIFAASSIVPFYYEKVIFSVKKTGRFIVIGHENERASILTDFAYEISSRAEGYLKRAPKILGTADFISPSYENLGDYVPNIELIEKKILELFP